MKRILYILSALLLTATSCQEEGNALLLQLAGEWHYTAEESGVTEDVWLSFAENGTFEIYQKIGEGPYWHVTGDFTLDPETAVLTGVYSDRYPWSWSYVIEVSRETLVMTAVELEGYSLTYTKEQIPAEVRDKSLPLTKSEDLATSRHL